MASPEAAAQSFADFLRNNSEPILQDWMAFAQSLFERPTDASVLEDHIRQLLLAVADDMSIPQMPGQQERKSKGITAGTLNALRNCGALHAEQRHKQRMSISDVVAEFRALRASVLKHWAKTGPDGAGRPEEVTRFNEAIDEALAASISSYSVHFETSRNLILGILAHDLRSPLQAASLSALYLSRQATSEGSIKAAARVLRSTASMGALISDLLDYATARLGQGIPVRPGLMNLRAVCAASIDQVSVAHPGRHITLEMDVQPEVYWDQGRLGQILANLLTNALIHSGEGEVSLRVTASGDLVTMDVHNGGDPIPESKRQGLFDPLYKASGAGYSSDTRSGSSGLGLGLYISRQIALAHHGDIEFRSSKESGTHFIVTLPRRPSTATH